MKNENILDMSVIIPFKDHSDLTIACLNSIEKFADPVKELLLVSNNSSKDELDRVKEAAKAYSNAKVLIYNHPFNFQKINNWAVQQSTGKVCFFLNNDVELLPEKQNLLRIMYKKSLEPGIGAVGCVLLYEDAKNIQHAGVYLVPGGTADHLYIGESLSKIEKKLQKGELTYDIRQNLNVNAVTAAAVVISRKNFDQVNGFNEAFIICGGDVDLCLRLNSIDKKTVLIGSDNGVMIHKESRSRSSIGIPYIDFIESYKSYINHFDLKAGDPYLHWREVSHDK